MGRAGIYVKRVGFRIKFRMRAENGAYVYAAVYRDLGSMRLAAREFIGRGWGGENTCGACCVGFERRGRRGAIMFFCDEFLGAGRVAHEIYHAVMRVRPKGATEEVSAEYAEELTRKFWTNYYRLTGRRRKRHKST